MIRGAPVRHLFMKGVVWYLNHVARLPLPINVLEIGSYRGDSALTWHEAGCEVTCVDSWDENTALPYGVKSAYSEFLERVKGKNITTLIDTSQNVLPSVKPDSFDIVFIDGDHRYDGVRFDIEYSLPIVRDGGIICGDDLNMQFPETAPYATREYGHLDFIRDTEGKKYHPGVTGAVWDYFGEVSAWGGFWAMQRRGRKWKKISLTGMPVVYPAHFCEEDFFDAKQHLKDIVI